MPQKNQLEELMIQREIAKNLSMSGPEIKPGQLPPRPAGLLPDPPVVGTDLARYVRRIMNITPELRRHVKEVTQGPTIDTIRALDNDASLYPKGDTLGFAPNSGRIFISRVNTAGPQEGYNENPRENQLSQLLHEFAHVAGHEHKSGIPSKLELLGLDLQDPTIRVRDKKGNYVLPEF